MQILNKFTLWKPLSKILQRLASMKVPGFVQLANCTVFDVVKYIVYLLLASVFLLQALAFQESLNWALIVTR